MERIGQLLLAFALLYGVYALTLKNWNYTTEADKQAARNRLKKLGLSSQYFMTAPGKLYTLSFLSGGLFLFYWFYQQWKAVCRGYKNTDETPLRFSPELRALFACVSVFQLLHIVNRTAQYLRKPTSFPAAFWGVVFWLAGIAAFAAQGASAAVTAYAVFLAVPCVIQARINAMVGQTPPNNPKTAEWVIALLGMAITTSVIWLRWLR